MENNSKVLSKQELVEIYDRDRKKSIKCGIYISLICIGAIMIVVAFLFRTPYAFTLKDEGKLYYSYHHVLMRDSQHFYMNKYRGHDIHYYIVYKSGELFYEYETDLLTYSEHAKKENVAPGITNHSVIQESLTRYTFTDKKSKTYCYENKTSKIKAIFDAANVENRFFIRLPAYIVGLALIIIFAAILKKFLKEFHAQYG